MPLVSDISGVLFGTDNIQVIGLQNVDLWYQEQHEIEVKTSDYPVEDGSSVSDNAYRKPYKIKLSGMITNVQQITPRVPFLFGSTGIVTTQKAKTGWALLDQFANAREPFLVITTVKTYHNMLITGVKTVINKETGTNLKFELEFKEIQLVGTTQEEVTPLQVLGDNNPASNSTDIATLGNKNPIEAPAPTSFASTLLNLGF